MSSTCCNFWRSLNPTPQSDIEEGSSFRSSSPQNSNVTWWSTKGLKIFIPGLSIVGAVLFLLLGYNSIIKYGYDWRPYAIAVGYIICSVLSATVFFYTIVNPSHNATAILPVTVLNAETLQAIRSELRRYGSEETIKLIPEREREEIPPSPRHQPSPRYRVTLPKLDHTTFSCLTGISSSSPESSSGEGSEQKKAILQSHPETEGILQPSAVGETPSSTKVLAVASAIAEITKGTVEESKSQFLNVEAPTEISSDGSTPDKDEVNGAVRQRKVGPTPSQPIVTFPENKGKE